MNCASRPRLAAFSASVTVTMLLAGGGHGGGGADKGHEGGSSSLEGALASIADTRTSRAFFEWADVTRIRDLGGITRQQALGADDPDHRRWSSLFGTGTAEFIRGAVQLADTIDLFTARSAVQIGTPPRDAVRLDGVDVAKAREMLVRRGGKPGTVAGHDGVITADDYVFSPTSPLADLGVFTILNKSAFDGDRVVFGPAEQPVADALAIGSPFRANQGVAEAAGCLGDVITADIIPDSTASTGAQIIGLGVRDPVHGTDRHRGAMPDRR